MSKSPTQSGRDRPTASESLKSALRGHAAFGPRSTTENNDVIARNILHGDLGHFRDEGFQEYNLDERARDRLIAHARQDAALAVLNSASILDELARVRRRQRIMILLLVAAVVLVWNAQ